LAHDVEKLPAEGAEERRIDARAGTHSALDRLDVDRAPPEEADPRPSIRFEQLYHDHFDFTYRTLRHLGVPEPALPDAVQEVWLAVYRQLCNFEGRSTHRTWLFSIALNTARNQRRWRVRHASRFGDLTDEVADARPGPEQEHAGREALALVQEFLDTLDEPRRVLFVSQLLEQLSAEETARLLGIERTSVYHRIRDLRRTFQRWMLSRQKVSP
jgi:RNA polymerase sigma-70 factor (ECF subfamily)